MSGAGFSAMTATGLLESKKTWLALLLIGLVAVYLPGLQGELIFDDQRLADGTILGSYGSLVEIKQRLLSYGSFVWIQALFGAGMVFGTLPRVLRRQSRPARIE